MNTRRYGDPSAREIVLKLKQELTRLKKELGDDDLYADRQPAGSSYVEPPPRKKP